MQVLFGQINTTPGDFVGNYNKIISGLERIQGTEVKLALFPELSIPGYSCKDMMYHHDFIERNLRVLEDIKMFTRNNDYMKDVHVVVGYIDRNHSGEGKPFTNMAAVVKNGLVVGTYQKHLLPFYDVFDEGRYYEPGTDLLTFSIDGKKFGVTICEDLWNDKMVDNYNYRDNPVERYRKLGVNNIINISSSPFVAGKANFRVRMISEITKGLGNNKLSVLYCNQVGAQDDLVFDGNSCFLRDGNLVQLVKPDVRLKTKEYSITHSSYSIFDTNAPPNYINHSETAESEIYKALVIGLRDYILKSGFKSVVLGSSGGIDSAVVAALAAEAIGPENVHCIMMPSVYSSEGSVNDAKKLHVNLGCKEYLVPINHNDVISHINTNLNIGEYNKVADENLQARMRGQIVMYFSNGLGALALTTGNKTELATGYFTIFGDSCGGFAPINDLYKMQVYALAKYINSLHGREIIPVEIIDKAPSAELAPNQTDEASLLPYPILDQLVKSFIEENICDFAGFHKYARDTTALNNQMSFLQEWCLTNGAKAEYDRIIRLINNNEFKRRPLTIGTKVSKIAFGSGRRLPIVKR